MNPNREQEPPPLVAGREPEPPQGGEIRARWAWVEAAVWTTRMLKALETGLEGKRALARVISAGPMPTSTRKACSP